MCIVNARKGSKIGPLPLLFIPFSLIQLEHRHADILQYFLTPLMNELVSSFVDGFMVQYCYPTQLIADGLFDDQQGQCRLRALLMFWTGDHPTQCKLGLLKDGGKNGCRGDCPLTSRVDQQGRLPFYVYDQNILQGRYPAPKKKIDQMYEAIRLPKRESTKKGKEEKLASAGLSGVSCLWVLYELYGFDIIKDLVFDVMHILALNLLKKYVKSLFDVSSNQHKKLIDTRTQEAIFAVPKSFKNQGRWPSINPSQHHNMFIAEEYQNFVMWCLPHILNTVTSISKEMKDLGMVLIDIAHIFYNYTRSHGWSQEEFKVAKQLLLSWRILSEDTFGPNASPLEHVAGNAEMLDDILQFGGHDGMWCYRYERAVNGVVAIPTNNKANEMKYAHHHSRVLFTKTRQNIKMEEDGLQPQERLLVSMHRCLQKPEGTLFDKDLSSSCKEWHKQGVLVATSEKIALDLFQVCDLLDPCPCKQVLDEKGVLVGPKKRKFRSMTDFERSYLESFWRSDLFVHELATFRKVFFKGEKYTVNENVIAYCSQQEGIGMCQIQEFFFHESHNRIEVFFVGNFSNNGVGMDGFPRNEVTGMKVISTLELNSKALQLMPISNLKHKCFLLPCGETGDHIIYEMQDNTVQNGLVQLGFPGYPPPWTICGDIVLANLQSDLNNLQHSVVRDVFHQSYKVKLGILSRITEDEWEVIREEEMWRDLNVCLKVLSGWIPLGAGNVNEARGAVFKRTRVMHEEI